MDLLKDTGLVKMKVKFKVWSLWCECVATPQSAAPMHPAPILSLIAPWFLPATGLYLNDPLLWPPATLSCPHTAPPLKLGTLASFAHTFRYFAFIIFFPAFPSRLFFGPVSLVSCPSS